MLCIINTLCRQGYLESRGIARTVAGFLTKNRPSCIYQRTEDVENEQTVLIKPHLLLPYLRKHFLLWIFLPCQSNRFKSSILSCYLKEAKYPVLENPSWSV